MSRISKWRLEKTKVKVVFRLQFHSTHIPQTGWEKLFITFIPADTGKPTAKTTKANVRNGSCKWGDPIYETTRLLQDSKSKQYDEKLYKLVVAMGSSRASVLGEATINLADYVDASKPTIEAFPLQGCNFGTVLHITVQLLTSKTGFREFEQQRELREKGLESGVDQYGVVNDQADKARMKFKADASELSSLEEEAIDGSSNTSGSLYAEKHETFFINELDGINCTTKDLSDLENVVQGSAGSIHGWGLNNSVDNELATACLENSRLKGSLESAESSVFNLKLEVSSLQGVTDELGAEMQKLSHELTAEMSSAEELAKEVSSMKSECMKFKDDIALLKDLKLSPRTPLEEALDDQVNDIVRDTLLQFSNGISVVEGKIRELQKRTCVITHDEDTKFINQELETLLDFLHDFKFGNGEVTTKIREMSQFESGNEFGLDLCPPESVLQHFSSSPPVSDVVNPLGPINAMKAQIFDLVRELDEAKVEKEGLTQKMDQMELYYEALIHELEVSQKCLLGELQLLRNDHTTCLYSLSASKTEAESLREVTNQQMLRFVDERRGLEAVNEELERRAASSEAALRRARLNYSIAVGKLQKDLELLSSQVTSMFEANENLIKQALPSQPDPHVEDDDATKFSQTGSGKRSVSMQEDLYRKFEEELVQMHSINLNLDIYSKALEQSLLEKTSELVEELKSSTASQNHLMLWLQKATDEINELNEFKSSSISQCSEMALQNQLLEDKLVSVSEENYLLAEKLIDWESTLSELRNCQSKYVACLAENTELSLQLKQEAFENEKLKAEFDEQKAELERKVQDLSLSLSKDEEKLLDFEQQRAELVRIRELASRLELEKSKLARLVEELEKNSSCQASLERQLSDMHDYTLAADVKLVYISNKYETVLEELQRLASSEAHLRDLQERFHDMESMLSHSRTGEANWRRERDSLLGSLESLRSDLEQYETKNEELKQQLSMSKKHGEEMLMRLQDAIDEIENRKKSEAVSLKRNEELSTRLSALEAELLSVIIEKREKSNAYDRTKAEMECALLSLECCKEENEKLTASLLEFEAQKSHLVDELASMNGQLEDLKSSTRNLQTFRINGETSDANDEHLGVQGLRSSIEHLHEELEKMKNENAIFNTGDDQDTQEASAVGPVIVR